MSSCALCLAGCTCASDSRVCTAGAHCAATATWGLWGLFDLTLRGLIPDQLHERSDGSPLRQAQSVPSRLAAGTAQRRRSITSLCPSLGSPCVCTCMGRTSFQAHTLVRQGLQPGLACLNLPPEVPAGAMVWGPISRPAAVNCLPQQLPSCLHFGWALQWLVCCSSCLRVMMALPEGLHNLLSCPYFLGVGSTVKSIARHFKCCLFPCDEAPSACTCMPALEPLPTG